MNKKLIIVESPAKIKTLQKLMGKDFVFSSSVGHIRDLPKKGLGIEIDNDFEPHYEILPDKTQVVKELIRSAKQCSQVYLSPDPDREGEAIAWHISQILPKDIPITRVTFNSITKSAVEEAIKNPRKINSHLVDAQQARRLLDRIVGYKISPLLTRRIKGGKGQSLSAGRVQSVALKLVVDREKAIEAFISAEYWNVDAWLRNSSQATSFKAYLYSIEGNKVDKEPNPDKKIISISSKEQANSIKAILEKSSFEVVRVDKREKKRHPVPPFITSTLQQEASRYYGFSSSRTMSIAQTLYEGIDLGKDGQEGLITYMRTDSFRIAPEALGMARSYIEDTYGKNFLPSTPRQFSSKKSAQDAHEAIRPANLYPPETIQKYLAPDQYKLYTLIWKRFIASQMLPAIYDTVSADIQADKNLLLRATGSIIKFPGFLSVYEEKKDDEKSEEERRLPNLEKGMSLSKDRINIDQAFTKPPARYSEASLVKELERSGIGRPSTYSSIMNKIQSRDYTIKEKGRLIPTELGRVIAQWLETHFKQIMDIEFTVRMEDDLESISDDALEWKQVLRDFWTTFSPTLDAAEEDSFVPKETTQESCPKCNKPLLKIWARSKYFYGCSGYPDCDYTADIASLNFNRDEYAPDFNWDQSCPKCEKEMVLRHGRFGPFLGCKNYPECKGIVNIPKKGERIFQADELPPCPAIGCEGSICQRKSRFGKTFFACNTYPECNVIVNELDELSTKYVDHPRTPYEKKLRKSKTTAASKKKKAKTSTKKKKTPRKKANQPNLVLSESLSSLLGKTELPRTQVIKEVWDYIKAHKLQDPDNKRMIVPDKPLGKVLGTHEPIDMFKMTGALSKNLSKKEA